MLALSARPCACAFALMACLWLAPAHGQPAREGERGEVEEFETDRDSFTFATTTAGPQTTIFESSYSFVDNRLGAETHSFPEILVRRGWGDAFEWRLGWNYEAGGPGAVSGVEIGGEDLVTETEARLLYGAKVRTSQARGWLPQSALIVQGFTPTAGPSSESTVSVGEAFGWTFANRWVWNSSIRYATASEQGDDFGQWAPSTVLKIPVGARWNVHAEYFGILSQGKEERLNAQFASFGGHVLLTPNFELGVRFGFGLNRDSPEFFNNVGLGWRF